MTGIQLTDMDRFVIHSLLNDMDSITMLSYHLRKKYDSIMRNYVSTLTMEPEHFNAIHSQLGGFLNYPDTPLGIQPTDPDKPMNWADFEEITDGEKIF